MLIILLFCVDRLSYTNCVCLLYRKNEQVMVNLKKKKKSHSKGNLYFQAALIRLFDYFLCDVDKIDQTDYEPIAKRASGKYCIKKTLYYDKLLHIN